MLFYFTGTGNSLYVAKGLERQPISIPQVMHREDLTVSDDRIGIVAPIYGHEVPAMVQEFLEKATFQTPYFYMILTYGNRHGGAAELAQALCARCGIPVRYINLVHMVDNCLPAFDMEEEQRKDKHVEEQLAAIQTDVAQKVAWIAPVTEADRAAHQEFLAGMRLAPPDAWQHLLRVSQDCIGCGICQRVCPSASIRLVEGRAEHVPGRCQTCLACAHACPRKAVQLTVPEKNPGARYRNPMLPCGSSSRPTSSPAVQSRARGDGRRARMTMEAMPARRSGWSGCSSGLGRSFVRAIVAQGDIAVATARDPETLRPLQAQHPGQVMPLALDAPGPDPAGGPTSSAPGAALTASSTTPLWLPGRRGGGAPE